MQGLLPVSSISFEGRDPGEIGELLRRIRECRLADRNKALAVIARRQGILSRIICRFLGIDRKSLRDICDSLTKRALQRCFLVRSTPRGT